MCKSHFKAHRREIAPIIPNISNFPASTITVCQPVAAAAASTSAQQPNYAKHQQYSGNVPPASFVAPVTHASSPSAAALSSGGGYDQRSAQPAYGPSSAAHHQPADSFQLDDPMVPFGDSVYDLILPQSIAWNASVGDAMPLIAHLKDGFDRNKPSAWHRNEERCARGLIPVTNPATQLEGWERELVWMEILVLTGVPGASFRHLARAWGRDKGFHMVLAQFICERRGNVERKKRVKASAASIDISFNQNDIDANAADIWDDACYGDAAYNEALAADLFSFGSPSHNNSNGGHSQNDNNNNQYHHQQHHHHHQHHQHFDQDDDDRVVSSSEDAEDCLHSQSEHDHDHADDFSMPYNDTAAV